jgi:hypothetical protein
MDRPSTAPSYMQVADELAARMTAEADAWGAAQTAPGDHPATFPLARLRFAARVVRELGFQVDRLAQLAREAGAEAEEVADAQADRSPPELRADLPGPSDA